MSAAQSAVAVGGIALVGANFWTGPQRQDLDNLVFHGQSTPQAKTALLQIGGESILLILLYLVAGSSSGAGTAMVVLVLTLWILYFMTKTKTASVVKPGGVVA